MGITTFLILLVITVCSDAQVPIVCTKIDQCSCNLTGVDHPGVIDLHSLVSGKEKPTFATQAGDYNYYYNPCLSFSTYGCPDTGICQVTVDRSTLFDLGNLATVQFRYKDNSVFAIYQSEHGESRTSTVELVCDESEVKGKFEFIEEPIPRGYQFKLHTRCACPGKCTSSQPECKAKDLCSCEMSDGTGTINLHSLDNPIYKST